MKIGIDIRTLMDQRYSGISGYTLHLVAKILEIDNDNEYRLFYNSARDMSGRIPRYIGDNIKLINTRYPNKVFNYGMQKILHWPKLNSLLGVDLFFMPHINFIALGPECHRVITVHDLSFLRYPEFFNIKQNIWHSLVQVKKLLRSFDTIIAVSQNTKHDIVELCGIPAEKIKVIHSGKGSNYKPLSGDDENLKKIFTKYNLPKKFILYLGTIEPRKNVSAIISAYNLMREQNSDLSEYKLVIAGASGWKTRRTFSLYKRSPYKKDILFLGYVDNDDKIYLYNAASIFVYPSLYEGFGFPPLEAMASGLPVITSNSSSLPEVVKDGAILVNPYNLNDIKEAMVNLLSDRNLYEYLKEKGLTIAKTYSWRNTAFSYIDLFVKLCTK